MCTDLSNQREEKKQDVTYNRFKQSKEIKKQGGETIEL